MEQNEIRHAWKKKEDVKYIERIQLPKRPGMKYNNYRYFYDRPSYLAYLKSQQETKEKTLNGVNQNIVSKINTLLNNKKTALTSTSLNKGVDAVSKLFNKFDEKKTIVKKSEDIKEKVNNKIETASKKAEEKVKNTQEKLNEKAEKTAEKIVKNIENAVSKIDKKTELTKEKVTQIANTGKTAVNDCLNKTEQTEMNAIGDRVENIEDFVESILEDGIGVAIFNAIGTVVADLLYPEESEEDDEPETDDDERDQEVPDLEDWERQRREELSEWEEERKRQEERQATEVLDDFSDLQTKDREYTNDEDQEETNPYYYTQEYAYTNNCAYCTAAYDLRQRGYDVEAAAIDYTQANTASEIMSWYDGAELVTVWDAAERSGDTSGGLTTEKAAEYLETDMLTHGEGARGHLLLYWADGGGHDVIWEVENGEVVMRDCQTNDTLELHDYIQYCSDVSYFRSDNLEPNENILKTVRNK